MTSLDDSFILKCTSILGTEYTRIKSEFRKYRNSLNESKWYRHVELRLYNIRLSFEVNTFTFLFSVVLPGFGIMLHKFALSYSLYHFQTTSWTSSELLNFYCIINRLSEMRPQWFNHSLLYSTLPALPPSVSLSGLLSVPQVCELHTCILFCLQCA